MTLFKYLGIFLLTLLHVLTKETEPGTVLTSVFVLHKYTHKSEIFLKFTPSSSATSLHVRLHLLTLNISPFSGGEITTKAKPPVMIRSSKHMLKQATSISKFSSCERD